MTRKDPKSPTDVLGSTRQWKYGLTIVKSHSTSLKCICSSDSHVLVFTRHLSASINNKSAYQAYLDSPSLNRIVPTSSTYICLSCQSHSTQQWVPKRLHPVSRIRAKRSRRWRSKQRTLVKNRLQNQPLKKYSIRPALDLA
jgi:hypothetical protein